MGAFLDPFIHLDLSHSGGILFPEDGELYADSDVAVQTVEPNYVHLS